MRSAGITGSTRTSRPKKPGSPASSTDATDRWWPLPITSGRLPDQVREFVPQDDYRVLGNRTVSVVPIRAKNLRRFFEGRSPARGLDGTGRA